MVNARIDCLSIDVIFSALTVKVVKNIGNNKSLIADETGSVVIIYEKDIELFKEGIILLISGILKLDQDSHKVIYPT